MEILLEQNLEKELKPYFKKYKSFLLDYDETLDEFLSDYNNAWNLFIMSIVSDNSNLKKCVNNLRSKGVDAKVINKYFYYFIKMKYKMDHKQYSWNEQLEWDIGLDDCEISTTKMSFF